MPLPALLVNRQFTTCSVVMLLPPSSSSPSSPLASARQLRSLIPSSPKCRNPLRTLLWLKHSRKSPLPLLLLNPFSHPLASHSETKTPVPASNPTPVTALNPQAVKRQRRIRVPSFCARMPERLHRLTCTFSAQQSVPISAPRSASVAPSMLWFLRIDWSSCVRIGERLLDAVIVAGRLSPRVTP